MARKVITNSDRRVRCTVQEDPTAAGLIVSHTGRRDSYELAYALSLSRRPVHLVTDFYYEPSTFLGRLARVVLGSSVEKRCRPDLSATVHSSPLLFCTDILERAFPRRKWVNMLRGWALGRRCVSVARQYDIRDIYAYYNSGARQVVEHLHGVQVTVFQMHPHPDTLVRIYERYLVRRPELRPLLTSQEEEMTTNRHYYDRLAQDARLAGRVLCTSSFTRDTLIAGGVPSERITVVPYGTQPITASVPRSSRDALPASRGIRLVFVGQFVLRKGIYELLRVACARPEVRLEIFSREATEARRLAEDWLGSLPANIAFRRILDDGELWRVAGEADFLVLPSLAEGFGLVIAEAMSHGLPVIATRNSAAADLIKDGENGFLMEDIFEEDLSHAINRAQAARESWSCMSIAARDAIADQTWPAFREGVLVFAEECCHGC